MNKWCESFLEVCALSFLFWKKIFHKLKMFTLYTRASWCTHMSVYTVVCTCMVVSVKMYLPERHLVSPICTNSGISSLSVTNWTVALGALYFNFLRTPVPSETSYGSNSWQNLLVKRIQICYSVSLIWLNHVVMYMVQVSLWSGPALRCFKVIT